MLQRTRIAACRSADSRGPDRCAGSPTRRPTNRAGYTISNPWSRWSSTVPTQVLQGVHKNAAYDIEVPPQWNGELVLWAHGYRGHSTVLTVNPPGYGLRERFVQQGYAWAASSYYANGYDVRAGVLSTYDLARHFADVVGTPSRTYIAGDSMGGHVIGRLLEQYPSLYAARCRCVVCSGISGCLTSSSTTTWWRRISPTSRRTRFRPTTSRTRCRGSKSLSALPAWRR